MPTPTPDLRALLAGHAERVQRTLRVASAAVSRWERDSGRLRTLVNAGAGEAFPPEEVYPLDTFPAIDALLRFGRPYVDPPDVASTAVLAHLRLGSQAAVPVVVEGRVWGELWAGSAVAGRAMNADDVLALARAADAIGRALAEREDA